MQSQQILSVIDTYLEQTGQTSTTASLSTEEKLLKYGMPALAASKSILADIQAYQPPSGGGFTRKLKNKVITVIRNVCISTVELTLLRQNKFNELSYQLLEHLMAENAKLREQIAKMSTNGRA